MEKEANVVLCKPANTTMFLMESRKNVALIIYKTGKGKSEDKRSKEKKEKEKEIQKRKMEEKKRKSERGIEDKGKRK